MNLNWCVDGGSRVNAPQSGYGFKVSTAQIQLNAANIGKKLDSANELSTF
jgi:hypothetical protein